METLPKTITLSILILLSVIQVTPGPVQADAPNPSGTIAVGDWWKYEFQTDLLGLTLRGTLTLTIEGEEQVSSGGASVDSHRLQVSGSGTASGTFEFGQITGTWIATGTQHQRKTDQAIVSSRLTLPVTITQQGVEFTVTVTVDLRNSTPEEIYRFPLSVGKSWTTLTETTLTLSSPIIPQPLTVTLHRTIGRVVESNQRLTVPAGTYETFLVTASDSSGTYMKDYYSPQAQSSVKNTEYNATTNQVITSQVLVDYSSWLHTSSMSVPFILRNYGLTIQADATISNIRLGTGSVTFQVTGPDGITGKGRVNIPLGLNRSGIQVQVDNIEVSAQVSKDSSHYQVYFNFPLSTHTVTVTYATGLQALILGQNLLAFLTGGAAFIAAIIAIVAFLIVRRSRRPAAPLPTVPPASPPPAEPPLSTPPAQ